MSAYHLFFSISYNIAMSKRHDHGNKSIWHRLFCKCKGCTGVPEGPFHECCVRHDEDYAKGGSKADKKAADQRFLGCMLAKKRWTFGAHLYYYGVRLLGPLFFKYKK